METSVTSKQNSKLEDLLEDETLHTTIESPVSKCPRQESFIIDGRYEVLENLGEGAFGACFKVHDKQTSTFKALKMPKEHKSLPVLQREISVMQTMCRLPDAEEKPIAQLLDFQMDGGEMMSSEGVVYSDTVSYFISEFAPHGDLASYILENNEIFKSGLLESEVFDIFQQLLEGLEFIHNMGFVHLDLKPDNFLLMGNHKILITDFALAKNINGEDGNGNFKSYKAGTKKYWSPEMFTNSAYNGVNSDIYALGVSLFILAFGSLPFNEAKIEDPLFRLLLQKPVEFWKAHPEASRRISEQSVSSTLIKLLNHMLCPYTRYRLSIEQIKSHSWFQERLSEVLDRSNDQKFRTV